MEIKVVDLTGQEAADLAGNLGTKPPPRSTGDGAFGMRFGEPVSATLVVALAAPTIQVLGLWLLKNRRRSSVRLELEREKPDGEKETLRVTVRLSDSDTTPEQIANKIYEAVNGSMASGRDPAAGA
jgi:hypothetical protein